MKTLEEALHSGQLTIKQIAAMIGKGETRTREMIAELPNVEKDTTQKPARYWLPDDDVVDEDEVIDDQEEGETATVTKPAAKKAAKAKTSGNLNPQPAIDAAKKKVQEKGGKLEWKERKWVFTSAKGSVREMSSADFAEWRKTL